MFSPLGVGSEAVGGRERGFLLLKYTGGKLHQFYPPTACSPGVTCWTTSSVRGAGARRGAPAAHLLRGRVLALIAVVAAGVVIMAERPCAGADPARQLLDKVRRLNQTTRKWTDRSQGLRLTIIDRRGGERKRELKMLTKKYGDDASRSILFFHSPPQVQGIGFLQWIEPQQPDRQWLYLPALKRVRQITGSTKRESFVGTDFSYEDLAIMSEILDWTESDARSRLLGDEAVDGQPCAIIEFTPLEADVGYGKIRLWLGRDDLVAHKYEFDDGGGRRAKTLLVSDIRTIRGIPAAHGLEMRNERSGSRTVVVVKDLRYDTGLTDDVFTQRRLERGV